MLLCLLSKLTIAANLEEALTHAQDAWGVKSPVTIRLSSSFKGCNEDANDSVALTEPITEWMIFQDEKGNEVRREKVGVKWYISINSLCNWNQEYLNKVVLHEYGHVLTGYDHSKDEHSIMYWIVWRNKPQTITAADRAAIHSETASN